MMRLLWITLILAGGWAGYWFVGSSGAETAARAWFEARRADGWVAEYAGLRVQGFPNRFDLVLTEPELADPETGLAWTAPRLDVLALSYKPNHVIVAFADRQLLATPLGRTEIRAGDMKASVVTAPALSLPLERLALVADDLSIAAEDERGTTMESLRMGMDRVEGSAATYRIALSADALRPALPFRARVDPEGRLPERLDAFAARIEVTFDAPWDRFAIEEARPQPTALDLHLAEARWGDLELALAGDLTFAEGVPEGRIVMKARNWREMLEMADTVFALPRGLRDGLERGLELAAGLAGNPRTLDVPLEFRAGRTWLGPLPIAPAPRIVLR